MKSSAVAPYLSLGMLLGFAAAAPPRGAGWIRASGKKGLGTKVNGVKGGSCNKGRCRISGGTRAGKNLFHRFSDFDTSRSNPGCSISKPVKPRTCLWG